MNSTLKKFSRSILLLPLLGLFLAGQTTITLDPVADTSMYEENGTLSNALGDGLFSGVTISGSERRALMRWDIAGNVPAGATITSVSLQMEVTMALTGTPIQNDLHSVFLPWGEGTSLAMGGQGGGITATAGDATWTDNDFGVSMWTFPGGDFNPTVSGTATAAGVGTSAMWSSTTAGNGGLVTDVQSWLDNPGTNYGWILIGSGGIPSARRFGSRESATPSDRPQLTITYTAGVPMASATNVGMGCVGTSGQALALNANGLPQLGNFAFSLGVSGGPAGLPAPLFFATGTNPAGFPISAGCNVYLDLTSAIAFVNAGVSPVFTNALNGAGATTYPLPLPNDPSLGGLAVDLQIVMGDLTGALISSNAVSLVLGS